MIGGNNETEDSKSVEEGAADRRESTRKRQQTAIFDPNAWQIEADIRKNRPENPPVSSSSDMATSSPHKKRLRRINNVLDDGQKEKAEKQGREKEKQIDIGDTSDYDENIEFDRAHLLLGIPSFGSSSTKKVALPQTSTEKEPRFVNSRQYRRIIQRRKWRESNATDLIKHAKERERVERQGYKYKSRHLHAKRRRRGPGGQFLTKSQLERLEKEEERHAAAAAAKTAAASAVAADSRIEDLNGNYYPLDNKTLGEHGRKESIGGGASIQNLHGESGRHEFSVPPVPLPPPSTSSKHQQQTDDDVISSIFGRDEGRSSSNPFLHGWTEEEMNQFSLLY